MRKIEENENFLHPEGNFRFVKSFFGISLFYSSFPKIPGEFCEIFRLDKDRMMLYNITRGAYVGYTIYSAIYCVCTQYIA